ncbi:glucoamylase family protein [Lunatibacter salilacus]|uniref:glucoamylase family protein n=1 Tax=Lunatibacter salilacus TaxID=2483804 RepID=UPI00131E4318|nr:glucoamylase family protein [Lunatibacter salilacus]
MKNVFLFFLGIVFFNSCTQDEDELGTFRLERIVIGEIELDLSASENLEIPVDRPITLYFSDALDPQSVEQGLGLLVDNQPVPYTFSLFSGNQNLTLYPTGALLKQTMYLIRLTDQLKATYGASSGSQDIWFQTIADELRLTSLEFEDANVTRTSRIVDVPLNFTLKLNFSTPIDRESILHAVNLVGFESLPLTYKFEGDDKIVLVENSQPLDDFKKYTIIISNELVGAQDESFAGYEETIFTQLSTDPKYPVISDEDLLTKVQEHTFRYFYDFAQQPSGMIRERNTSGSLVTTGGSGFGVMSLLVGISRGFISREQGVERIDKMVDFLIQADRFHGVWPHWLNGQSGSVIPFSANDDGADLVETALLMQGLLTARAFLDERNSQEGKLQLKITQLWEEVEWDWFTRNGEDRLYWHWSPNSEWAMNLPISGYNEALITYLLAASSPTHAIDKRVYHTGWAGYGAMLNGKAFYGISLPLGEDLGGPLFFSHYTFLGVDPRKLQDQYANYWEQGISQTLINRAYCIDNPRGFAGYSEGIWGLTASDNQHGYNAHSPRNDLGVITPTASIGSMPYAPDESLAALKTFYYQLGDRLWGEFGFYDAFNPTEDWYADSYLAIDQGPIILMIENYRTGLLWDLMMQDSDLKVGLEMLGFSYE